MRKLSTLLVPTDFSPAAKAAAFYAASMAVQIKAKVILLSVIELEMETAVLQNWKKLEKQLRKSAEASLEKLEKEIRAKVPGLDLSSDIAAGLPMHEVIERYAAEKKVNMIIMGTKGATGLQKILRGTNTSTLMETSSFPVLAIPSKAVFNQIKTIAYASDLKKIKREALILAAFASLFQARLMIVHAVPKGTTPRQDKNLEAELIESTKYKAISYHQVSNDSIDEAITSFVVESKADMLVMFTHELDFFEKLLGRSVTREIAFDNKFPLLVVNRGIDYKTA